MCAVWVGNFCVWGGLNLEAKYFIRVAKHAWKACVQSLAMDKDQMLYKS